MSSLPKDPKDNKETDLKRGSSALARSLTEDSQSDSKTKTMYNRSQSIDSDDNSSRAYQDRPVSENERGLHDTRPGSLGLNSTPTVNGPDEDELPDPATAFNSRLRPSAQPAAERDTLNISSSGNFKKQPGDAESSSGPETSDSDTSSPETSSETGATVTDSGVLEEQENRQPPTTTAIANPTAREAPRTRHARKNCCWAMLCFSGILVLIVIALTLACATGYESSSAELQGLCNPVFQAGAGVTSVYLWTQYTVQQLYLRLPTLQAAPRHSSGEQLGAGLGQIYANLSQALAAGDSLYQAPKLISEKRGEAMSFRLPEGSRTKEYLQLFLQQSVHIDEDLLRLILSLGQVSSLALRQQQLTSDTLHSIQLVEYFGPFQTFRIRVLGISTQESQLQTRLEEHFRFMNEIVTGVDRAARDVLQEYIVLTSTTNDIRQSSIQDREGFLLLKEETASHWNWALRASIHIFGLSEPEDLALITQNIDLAQSIDEWAQGVVDLLQRVVLHLKYAKIDIQSVMETLNKYGTITWDDVADKDRTIQEFLARIAEGQELLTYNRAAWFQLQWGGHI